MLEEAATARTRGELLRRADTAIRAAEDDLFAARRPLLVVAWSIALLVLTAMPSIEDGFDGQLGEASLFTALLLVWWACGRFLPWPWGWRHVLGFVVFLFGGAALLPLVEDGVDDTLGRVAFTILWVVVAAICVRRVWTYSADNRRLGAEVDAWVAARRDPELRLLDDGDVTADVATVHDVRDWADHDAVASDIAFRHQLRQQTLPVVVPTFVLMVTGLVGLGSAIAAALGAGGDLPWAVAVGAGGLITFAPLARVVGDLWHTQVQRAAEFNRTGTERRLYAIRRHHLAGAPEPAPEGRPVVAQVVVAMIGSGGVGLLIARVRTSSSLAVLVAVAIIVVVTAIVVVRAWWHGRGTRVFPLAGAGPSVLQSPARRVELSLDGGVLTIADPAGQATSATIPLDDVLALEPLSKRSVITGRGLGIVTPDAPVVLTGRGLADDPAIVELRRLRG
ncbi:hypothetical protein [Aeromicrobium fastidiosum]|uniref:Uncharacterized protein n=1 Tax=Aeromicrobium fastidiosum TaxID=52699 RepID=A0A641APQ5_9ACTN|nr:hypothetical protein [Aeromicrobium fastidiosum]KAA1380084.1 hypothetical protein ESP62_002455 [Aeromicrobium fastidiosum]MBP2389614.1 hypothetical protein [Aeromicrobium fastidiosum]